MLGDKKPTGLAGIILAKANPPTDTDDDSKSDSNLPLDSAIDDMWEAQEKGDKEAYKKAFQSAVSFCDPDYSSEEEK
jgi:hypothetical protein